MTPFVSLLRCCVSACNVQIATPTPLCGNSFNRCVDQNYYLPQGLGNCQYTPQLAGGLDPCTTPNCGYGSASFGQTFTNRTHLWEPQVNSGIVIQTQTCNRGGLCQDCSGWQGNPNYIGLVGCNDGSQYFSCNMWTPNESDEATCYENTLSSKTGTPYFVTPSPSGPPTCTSLLAEPWPAVCGGACLNNDYKPTGPVPIPYTTEMCIAINSGCVCTPPPGADFHSPTNCTCTNGPAYNNEYGVSYNVSCCGVGEHFASYNMEWPSSYSQDCEQLVDTLARFQITVPGINGGNPLPLGYASATKLLEWVCYDWTVDLQGQLWSATNRNCNSSAAGGSYQGRGDAYGWSHPLDYFNGDTLDGTDPFFCCIQQGGTIPTASCAIESACFDSGYCIQTLYDTCSSAKLTNPTYAPGCQAWLAWAASHSTQSNATNTAPYRGAYDTSADAAFQSVYTFCAGPGQATAACTALSLTSYTQVFPRVTAFAYTGVTTITTESLAIGIKNVSNKQLWAAVVSPDLNINETMIQPTSLSLAPGETGAFTVSSTPQGQIYTTTRGLQTQDTYRQNLPYWGRDRSPNIQEVYEPNWGPNCDANANPYINSFSSLSIANSPNVKDRPPRCFGADVDVTNLFSSTWQRPGWFLVQDQIGYFSGWVSVSTLTTASKYQTGNNPWGYDCSTTYYNYFSRTVNTCCQGETSRGFANLGYWFCAQASACSDPFRDCAYCNQTTSAPAGCDVVNFTNSAIALPSYPSCQATQTVPESNGTVITITQNDSRWVSYGCDYDGTSVYGTCTSNWLYHPSQPTFFIRGLDQCRSAAQNEADPFPDAVNGACDPWGYQQASYSLFRICSSTGLANPNFNIYLVDGSEFGVNSYTVAENYTNRRVETSRDYPILGGWLMIFEQSSEFSANGGNYALYAYPLTLDNNYTNFFG